MKARIETDEPLISIPEDMVGNVYQVRGGKGARLGHMHVIVSAYSYGDKWDSGEGFATLTIDREGKIVGANSYGQHYFMDKMPIAKCDGIDEVELVVRSL
ncbi:MAG: hypothetical protein JKY36_05655 [Erythrobacter sp.]|nr:hypothetical protein [Erythrobacter sp.]